MNQSETPVCEGRMLQYLEDSKQDFLEFFENSHKFIKELLENFGDLHSDFIGKLDELVKIAEEQRQNQPWFNIDEGQALWNQKMKQQLPENGRIRVLKNIYICDFSSKDILDGLDKNYEKNLQNPQYKTPQQRRDSSPAFIFIDLVQAAFPIQEYQLTFYVPQKKTQQQQQNQRPPKQQVNSKGAYVPGGYQDKIKIVYDQDLDFEEDSAAFIKFVDDSFINTILSNQSDEIESGLETKTIQVPENEDVKLGSWFRVLDTAFEGGKDQQLRLRLRNRGLRIVVNRVVSKAYLCYGADGATTIELPMEVERSLHLALCLKRCNAEVERI